MPYKDKEKTREAQRRWAAKNPEYWKCYHHKNSEHIISRVNKWRKDNPEKFKENYTQYAANRRARIRNAECDFSLCDWRNLVRLQNSLCFYCGSKTRLTRDHKIPLIRGGNHTKENIVGACRSCNSRKGTKTMQEFLLERGEPAVGV